MFVEFGVHEAIAGDVDEFLFLDLMNTGVDIRRIKVEARISRRIFWVYLDVQTCVLSFQATPVAPFTHTTAIMPHPDSLIRSILAHYNIQLPPVSRRCPVYQSFYVRRIQ